MLVSFNKLSNKLSHATPHSEVFLSLSVFRRHLPYSEKIIRQINSKYLLAFFYQIEYNFTNSKIHANECKAYRPTVDLENGSN